MSEIVFPNLFSSGQRDSARCAKNQTVGFSRIVKNVNEGFASDQEICSDFLMPDGCDDENEYGAILLAAHVVTLPVAVTTS